MIKRIHYTIWKLLYDFGVWFEPKRCYNEDKNHRCTLDDPDCPLKYCDYPEGHPQRHSNSASMTIEWD